MKNPIALLSRASKEQRERKILSIRPTTFVDKRISINGNDKRTISLRLPERGSLSAIFAEVAWGTNIR